MRVFKAQKAYLSKKLVWIPEACVMTDRERAHDRRSARFHAQLHIDVLQMLLHGTRADGQQRRDLGIGRFETSPSGE